MISVDFYAQLGNQFFQYCMGKIVAKRTGQKFVPPERWKNKAGRPMSVKIVPPPTTTVGRAVPGVPQEIHTANWVDLGDIKPNRPVHLRGYFQRYELLQPWKQSIRNDWLRLQLSPLEILPGTVCVHVRRTDCLGDELNPDRQCQATTLDEYAHALRAFSDIDELLLVSDDYGDPFLAEFKKFGYPVRHNNGTLDLDFWAMASCDKLLISQSTFSWWAGFLGRATQIVCPISRSSFWGRGVGLMGRGDGGDYPNLYPYDEPERWKWVVM